MKRIANTLPLLALTALLMPACSFSFNAGSGSKNPNPTAKPNGGDAKGPANAPKKVSKSGDDPAEGRPNEDGSAPAANDADAGGDDAATSSGEAPPKGAGKTGVKETGVAGSANQGGQNPGSTLTSKPDAPSGPGDRVKSPN